jgi:hypothetical protein
VFSGLDHISFFPRGVRPGAAPLRTLSVPGGAVTVDAPNDEVYVVRSDTAMTCPAISVYPRTATGPALPRRVLSGLSTGLLVPAKVLLDPLRDEILVSDRVYGGGTVVRVYPRLASGNAAPLRTVAIGYVDLVALDTVNREFIAQSHWGGGMVYTLPYTVTGSARTGQWLQLPGVGGGASLTLDPQRGEIIVGSFDPSNGIYGSYVPTIRVFDRLGRLLRTIHPPGIAYYGLRVAADTTHGETLAMDLGTFNDMGFASVTAYDSAGSAVWSFARDAPSLVAPAGLTADVQARELFVSSARGVTPTALSSGATDFGRFLRTAGEPALRALALAPQGEIVGVVGNAIRFYPRAAPAGTAPTREIAGAATGIAGWVRGLAVDTLHDEVLVLGWRLDQNLGSNRGRWAIAAFPRGASGNAPPLRTLLGNVTQLDNAVAIALDPVTDEAFVLSATAVVVHDRRASGNAVPIATLSGPATALEGARAILIDTVNDEIFVALEDDAILVFPRWASGNTAPSRVIRGESTGLRHPIGLAFLDR